MKTRIILNRGSNTENDTFTGLPGEIVYDTTNLTLRIHDGVTPGGSRLATIYPNNQINANNFFSIGITSNSAGFNSLSSNNVSFANANIQIATVNTSIIQTANIANAVITTAQINSLSSSNSTIVSLSSNTIQANSITVEAEPTSNSQLANKSYVDRQVRLAIALSGI